MNLPEHFFRENCHSPETGFLTLRVECCKMVSGFPVSSVLSQFGVLSYCVLPLVLQPTVK